MINKIQESIKVLEKEFVDIRHQIHQNPELGFKEENTSKFIADKLSEYGYKVTTGFAGTGLVGTLKIGDGTKTIGLRADMDALPIQETNGVPYMSNTPKVAHLCGHDGHTTMLLCAAKYLAETKDFNGTLNLIFQPAEELLYGGRKMLEDGLFKKFPCDAIFAMHNGPEFEVGHAYFKDGALMASSDTIEIKVLGCGGHGALPEKTVDTVVMASNIVVALQSIVSRNVAPAEAAVVTVGSFQAGDAPNVISGDAILKLSVRTLDKDVRQRVIKRIEELANNVASAFGGKVEFTYINSSPVLYNGVEATAFARKVAIELLGEDKCHDAPPVMGSEDFAFMLEEQPNGCYFVVGNGFDGPNGKSHHNPGYDFNDEAIVTGSSLFAALAESYLK